MPGSGVGPSGGGTSNSVVNERRNVLQSYLADLVMIPSIKESNQLKAFLGIKEHFPEFYNQSMDEIRNDQNDNQLFNLKEFITAPPKEEAPPIAFGAPPVPNHKSDLLKFIKAPTPAMHK